MITIRFMPNHEDEGYDGEIYWPDNIRLPAVGEWFEMTPYPPAEILDVVWKLDSETKNLKYVIMKVDL